MPLTRFVPVYPDGLFPQDISCKLLIEYIYMMFMNVGSMNMYTSIPTMYPEKFSTKSIGLRTIGTKYTESMINPQRVKIEKKY